MTATDREASDVDLLVPRRSTRRSRRRAWLRAGCAIMAVAIYLCWWTAYALNGLSDYGRYRQLDPGASAQVMGAEFRLVSLVQTTQLTNQITDQIVPPSPNAVWLIARVDVQRETESDYFLCAFEVLGPDRRIWEPDTGFVSRDLTRFCDKESAPIGQVMHLEVAFQVPERYVNQLAGVVVDDGTSRAARPVMVAPAG